MEVTRYPSSSSAGALATSPWLFFFLLLEHPVKAFELLTGE